MARACLASSSPTISVAMAANYHYHRSLMRGSTSSYAIPRQIVTPKCSQINCMHSTGTPSYGRRSQLALTTLLLLQPLNLVADVKAAEFPQALSKFVKRKKLDPLETYVPAIILSQEQFANIEKNLQSVDPKYSDNRSLLRSGPASALRINARAIAQYASDSGDGKVASDAIDMCLSALEDLDSLLLRATRNDSTASVATMKEKVTVAVSALDRLLQTVPTAVLEKAKSVAADYNKLTESTSEKDNEMTNVDVKILEEIL